MPSGSLFAELGDACNHTGAGKAYGLRRYKLGKLPYLIRLFHKVLSFFEDCRVLISLGVATCKRGAGGSLSGLPALIRYRLVTESC